MIECINGSLYTGYTTDVERRYIEHLSGSIKCKYTRSFPPKKLAASWDMGTELSAALRFEKYIKQLDRAEKQKILNNDHIHKSYIGQ